LHYRLGLLIGTYCIDFGHLFLSFFRRIEVSYSGYFILHDSVNTEDEAHQENPSLLKALIYLYKSCRLLKIRAFKWLKYDGVFLMGPAMGKESVGGGSGGTWVG
jgi:hypothetical protein